MKTIPDSVLEKIRHHRPQLGRIIDNLNAAPSHAAQFEKAIADAYLAGGTKLTLEETWRLSACCVGKGFGGAKR